MKPSKEEKVMRKAFRDLISEEVRRPEVRRDKKAFIQSYFAHEPLFFLRPGFFVPAAGFVAAILVFVLFGKPVGEVHQTKMLREASQSEVHGEPQVFEEVAQEMDAKIGEPMVEVKRVVSRVGTPMVYQKMDNGQPITIIWVFTGGSTL